MLIVLSGDFEGVFLLWGLCAFKHNTFQRLNSFPSCFDQSPVCCYKTIFHSALQPIMHGYFKTSTVHPQISALLAVVSLQCVVTS